MQKHTRTQAHTYTHTQSERGRREGVKEGGRGRGNSYTQYRCICVIQLTHSSSFVPRHKARLLTASYASLSPVGYAHTSSVTLQLLATAHHTRSSQHSICDAITSGVRPHHSLLLWLIDTHAHTHAHTHANTHRNTRKFRTRQCWQSEGAWAYKRLLVGLEHLAMQ